jgi:hypothetical protein
MSKIKINIKNFLDLLESHFCNLGAQIRHFFDNIFLILKNGEEIQDCCYVVNSGTKFDLLY